MSVDLHIHSTASDGLHTPREILAMAARGGLNAIAVTDHDSVGAVDEAVAASDDYGVEVVPALELSSHIGEHDVHFLGYFIDQHNSELAQELGKLREARAERATKVLELLREEGIDVSAEELQAFSGDAAVGRPHIAALLIDKGYSSNISEAFTQFLQRGACCYVDKEVMAPEDVIGVIARAGGVPVIAHPGLAHVDEHIPSFIEFGLQGIEALHADHTPKQMDAYSKLARKLDLVITGGSDFHGERVRGSGIGVVDVPDWVLDELRRRAGR